MQFRRKLKFVVLAAVLAVAVAVVWFVPSLVGLGPTRQSVAQQLRTLKLQSIRGNHADVVELADQLSAADELNAAGAMLAAESCVAESLPDRAGEFYGRVDVESDQYVPAQLAMASLYRGLGEISKAEAACENVLAMQPDTATAHSTLALFKMATGRSSLAVPHLRELLRLEFITGVELGWLAFPDRGVNAEEYLVMCREKNTDDSAPVLGLAAAEFSRSRFRDCETLLNLIPDNDRLHVQKQVLQLQVELQTGSHPTLPDDVAVRLQLYRNRGDYVGLFALGAAFEANGQLLNASLCFARCLEVSDYLPAMQHLATLLSTDETKAFGEDLDLVPLRRRVAILSRLQTVALSLQPDRMTSGVAVEISEAMEELGRHQESIAWAALGQRSNNLTTEKANGATAENAVGQSADIRGLVEFCLAKVPELRVHQTAVVRQDSAIDRIESADVAIVDEASERGIDFQYYESPDTSTAGRRMIEFTGGGVGVLDIDNDTWPDLHLTQGADWPVGSTVGSGASVRLDAVYRNVRGTRFADVTTDCAVLEKGFSQGIACGDLNNDGFTDVVVANIGRNSYWINQGDGTFTRLADNENPQAQRPGVWTSSCAVADVNQDGAADIIEVNYVGGVGFDSLICETSAGPRVCPPHSFQPTTDRLLLNNGDGSFTDISQQAGFEFAGSGLGLIVANFDQDPQLEIFVANDAMPNALWDNTAPAGELPVFQDVAVARGVSVGGDGKAQACMGVAAGDFDGDGTTDLYVTNYFNEPNALYLFNDEGVAIDAAMQTGLGQHSISLLGFGTQSLDANSDGRPDLFLVNGDLDDFAHEQRPFQMRPQLMFNGPDGFYEQKNLSDHDVRQTTFRGRGVARCDWNRDQRWDLVVSRLDDSAMLLTSVDQSHSTALVNVKLIGTASARDAIGSSLQRAGNLDEPGSGRRIQLVAGSGYMASNELSVLVMPGKAGVVWPGEQNVFDIEFAETVDQAVVEGRKGTYRLPR